MALGGGSFSVQNKSLPGAYINFVSASNASASLADRGIVTIGLELDWGIDDEVFQVDYIDFQKYALEIFGYNYGHDNLYFLRDLFKNAVTVYAYRLNSGNKASNKYAIAKYSGIRGNDIKISIEENIDNDGYFDISTIIDGSVYQVQTVSSSDELESNCWVDFKFGVDLEEGLGIPLEGGSNGDVSGGSHQDYLNKIEKYSYNAIGVVSDDEAVKSLYVSFVKRMRDEVGSKFQLILHDYPADYEGVVSIKNPDVNGGSDLVYWATGVIGGCAINKSNSNKIYDGEVDIYIDYTQNELSSAISAGEFVLHQVGNDVRVLEDINTLITASDYKGEVFKDNQTIRVIDQIANDLAVLFASKYLGVIQNNNGGRISLWSDIVKHHENLQSIGAIEDFSESDVVVEEGNSKKEVVVTDCVTVINAMNKLYMTVTVS